MKVRGFSLLEVVIVLVLVGLLLGGGTTALRAVHEQTRASQQQRQFDHIRAALYGFAMSHGRLPCPDVSNPPDGREDQRSDGRCARPRGALPGTTLGLAARDAWGHHLDYVVDERFSGEPPPDGAAFGFADAGRITVRNADGTTLASQLPAIVISWGAIGDRAGAGAATLCPAEAGLSEDERANCQSDRDFIDPGLRSVDAPAGPFRLRFAWPSTLVLRSRLVDAGRLP